MKIWGHWGERSLNVGSVVCIYTQTYKDTNTKGFFGDKWIFLTLGRSRIPRNEMWNLRACRNIWAPVTRKRVSVKTVFSNWMTSDDSHYSCLILFGVFELEFVAFEVELVFGSEDELGFTCILESVGNRALYPFKQRQFCGTCTQTKSIYIHCQLSEVFSRKECPFLPSSTHHCH